MASSNESQQHTQSTAVPGPVQSHTILEADNQDVYDTDSAFGSDGSTITTSIASSIFDYKYHNGRRYHAYREGAYVMPNDEKEQDRLDLLHHIWRLLGNGSLFVSPIKNPQRILDFGTGTGIWAIDTADEFPEAEVIGTDLSPIQPTWVPPNVKFMVDDLEEEWPFSGDEKFDLIHGRGMAGSVKDWDRLYAQVMRHLKPGGWVEMQEYEYVCQSDDGSMERATNVSKFTDELNRAAHKFGKPMDTPQRQKEFMERAGFAGIQDDLYKVPIGPWPKDKGLKEVGRYQFVQTLDSIEAIGLQLFTQVLEWSLEDTQELMKGVRNDFRKPSNHIYTFWHFTRGQKPLEK